MNLKKFTEITSQQIKEKGTQSLADRPNLTAQYGVSGLSPQQLKLWFDKLATFLAGKINEIIKGFSSDSGAEYIRVCLDEYKIDNLSSLIESFINGEFASKVLYLYPNAAAREVETLQIIINNIAKSLTETKVEDIVFLRKTDMGDNAYNIVYGDGSMYEIVAPRGEKGEKGNIGPQGEKGEKGEKGDSGDIAGQNELDKINKDIENIYTLLDATVTDKKPLSQAYSMRETADGNADIIDGSLTPVNLIAGDTVRCKNLIPYPYKTTAGSSSGITYTVNSDGSVTVNGTATDLSAYSLISFNAENLAGQTVALSMGNGIDRNSYVYALVEVYDDTSKIGDFSSYGTTTTYTIPETAKGFSVFVAVKSGATVNNFVVYPMLEIGTTATGFQPYFTGLKHAYFKGIKSTGKNLFNIKAIDSMEGCTISEDGVIFAPASAGYLISTNKKLKELCPNLKAGYKATFSGTWYPLRGPEGYAGNGIYLYESQKLWQVSEASKTQKLTEEDLNSTVGIYAIYDDVTDITISNLQIEYGETATAYEAYREDNFDLPETLEMPAWITLNPQTGELTNGNARVGNGRIGNGQIVCDGTEDWYMSAGDTQLGGIGYRIGLVPSGFEKHNDSSTIPNTIISNIYDVVTGNDTWFGRKTGMSIGSVELTIYDIRYCATSDISLWKAHLEELYAAGTPLIVEYKKATPTVEKLDSIPKSYLAKNGGSETVVQGETDNSKYGAMPEITQEYYTQKGGK